MMSCATTVQRGCLCSGRTRRAWQWSEEEYQDRPVATCPMTQYKYKETESKSNEDTERGYCTGTVLVAV